MIQSINEKIFPASKENGVSSHFHFLDALRGFAAVWVMFYHLGVCHAFGPIMWQRISPILQGVFVLGSHGVEIFFLLSGFVIAYSMCRLDNNALLSSRPLQLFLIRRWVRLTPPYWGACVLSIILILIESKIAPIGSEHISLSMVLSNLFYLQYFLGFNNLFAPAWSLVVEVQFYIVFSFFLLICYKFNKSASLLYGLTLISGFFSVIFSLIYHMSDNRFFFPHWCHFAAGILIYLTLEQPKKRIVTGFYLAAILVAGFLHFNLGYTDLRSEAFGLLATFFSGSVIWFLAEHKLLSTVGNGKIWQWLGKISYSLYLIHMQLGIILMKIALKIFGENASLGWVSFMVVCILCMALSQIVYLYLERPSILWSQKLKTKVS